MRNPGMGKPQKMPKLKNMYISIGYNEIELMSRIKKYGRRCYPKRRVWQLPHEKVKELDLLGRINEMSPEKWVYIANFQTGKKIKNGYMCP